MYLVLILIAISISGCSPNLDIRVGECYAPTESLMDGVPQITVHRIIRISERDGRVLTEQTLLNIGVLRYREWFDKQVISIDVFQDKFSYIGCSTVGIY